MVISCQHHESRCQQDHGRETVFYHLQSSHLFRSLFLFLTLSSGTEEHYPHDNQCQYYETGSDTEEKSVVDGDLPVLVTEIISALLLDAEIDTVNTQTEFTLASGSNVDDAYNDQAIVLYDDSNSDYPSIRVITDYTGSTKTVVIDEAPDFTLGDDDSIKVFVTAPGTTAPTAAAIRSEIDSNSTQLAAIVEDTGTTLPSQISGLNDLSSAEVQSACDTALSANTDINNIRQCSTRSNMLSRDIL